MSAPAPAKHNDLAVASAGHAARGVCARFGDEILVRAATACVIAPDGDHDPAR